MALGRAPASYGFRFDAGRVCLDLLATSHPEERLAHTEALCAWIAGADLVPAGTPMGHVDVGWLMPFRELRSAIRRLVPGGEAATVRRFWPYDAALDRVNDLARAAPPAPRALRSEDGTLVRELAGPPECAALLAAVARDTVDLLTDPVARSRLRRCEGDSCPIVYLDTSRGRRRRWCSSEVCGNRERVARHRRRTAIAGA